MISAKEAKENSLNKKAEDKREKDLIIKDTLSFFSERIKRDSLSGKTSSSFRFFENNRGKLGFRIQITDGHANTPFLKEEISLILLELGYTISDRNNNFKINW